MIDELFRRVALYQATMSLMRGMLKMGILSEKEYAAIDTKFAEKYGLTSSSIYR